jgi:hypothetical protein
MTAKPLLVIMSIIGILIGHDVAYRFYAATSSLNLEATLATTGHSWYSHFIPIILTLITISIFSVLLTAKRFSLKTLLLAQVLGFSVLEVSERFIFNGSFTNFGLIMSIGILTQILASIFVYVLTILLFEFKSGVVSFIEYTTLILGKISPFFGLSIFTFKNLDYSSLGRGPPLFIVK